MSNGFVYVWKNNVNCKFYVGSHKGTPDDGYICSSKYLKGAMKKYGMGNFTRHIYYEGADFREEERWLLNMLNASKLKECYNQSNIVGEGCYSEEAIAKRSAALKGKLAWNKGMICPSISEGRKGQPSPNKGKTASLEARKNMSEAHKNKTHTENTKIKMSSSQRKRYEDPEELKKQQERVRKHLQNPDVVARREEKKTHPKLVWRSAKGLKNTMKIIQMLDLKSVKKLKNTMKIIQMPG